MKTVFIFLMVVISGGASAACEIVDGVKRIPFDGKTLDSLVIEKKSLIILNRQFPNLNVIETMFKGQLQTCTSCTEKYITCTPDAG
jgi:hypothetical protein